ncbi:hypothetical protein P4493_04890 [Bacillus thuringiensis]|uniref:Membrane protein n=3 Tax=Bacillus thuringiensis TaxID=1428 RepID=A0A0B5N7N5_BACTU|nr:MULTISPECIES: hypothetical protein [Bacillus]EAO56846.1 hypothetical protein RBTH_07576 [Bacillus thuringiensis serovar israelensis ATCC 35646]MEC2536206.1 hypothetical protein [Bacillus cereus]MED1153670.1 hypothetical protein [Bacillus paranthracis]OUB09453.1 hypothetical protein BK708_33585 [Bacillus thuringiensis serovar yunnanensis]AFQ29991.1 hypothetical protein BTF1_29452 [Bacillus thuringiensis HD-789]
MRNMTDFSIIINFIVFIGQLILFIKLFRLKANEDFVNHKRLLVYMTFGIVVLLSISLSLNAEYLVPLILGIVSNVFAFAICIARQMYRKERRKILKRRIWIIRDALMVFFMFSNLLHIIMVIKPIIQE